ncbi:MAG: DUF4382 domain-containing protein [Dehalococcoidia bacterium]|jgi:hypothetical protein
MRKTAILLSIVLLISAFTVIGGGSSGGSGGAAAGTLQFYANGEDFVREGFVSKDGWSITFDHVYITLSDITAYQTDPAYDAHSDGAIAGNVEVALSGIHTIDLAAGDEDADPILVGNVHNVATGHYNSIYWKMAQATSGPSAGYSLVMIGTAEKDGETVDFSIKFDSVCEYSCGEYVGDERKGIVSAGGSADLEMTFHFDHLFGDIETPADDELNLGAPGFEALLAMQAGGDPGMNMADLHLGHVGEGHCHCECD